MQFLVLLLVASFLAWTLPARLGGRSVQDAMRRGLGLAFLATGASHFAMPNSFLVYFPGWVPAPEALVYLSGLGEIGGGLALFNRRYQTQVGRAMAAYLVLVFPANVYAALAGVDENLPGLIDAAWYPWVRLPFQALFVWWALRSTGGSSQLGGVALGPPLADRVPLIGRARGTLLVLCSAIFLEGIDVSMIGVALPSIRAELGLSAGALQWVVSGYVLGYGGFLLLGGRVADLLGRRRMFLLWLGVFLVFSGLGALATNGVVLVLARFVTGVSAAFLTPAGLSIITTTFPEGPARTKALSIYGGTAAAGFSLGLVVGGLLSEIGWRWVFFAPVLLALATLLAAVRLVPAAAAPPLPSHRFDLAGAAALTGGMLLLVLTVVEAPAEGWGSARTIGSLLGVCALLAAFVAIERRSSDPLVRLGILRCGPLVRANLGAASLAGSFFGFQFVVVLYLQQFRGWSALEAGLALLPAGVDAVIAPTLTPRLVGRFGLTRVIGAGLGVAALAYALFLPIGPNSSYAAMFPTMILTGVAFALAYGPLTIAATNGIAPDEQGLAGGLVNTSFQFGGALGLATVVAVLGAATGTDGSPQALLDGYRAALIVPLVAAVLGVGATALGVARRFRSAPGRSMPSAGGLTGDCLGCPDAA
jgi:MFS family permease/uncharacterized membrane protein